MSKIVIVDYGLGNIGSIINMIKKIGYEAVLSKDPGKISTADKLLLPGVGAFDRGMESLNQSELIPVLNDRVMTHKIPILGICLGMQLLTKKSDEGSLPGLGWINAEVKRFQFAKQKKIPHMGWNTVSAKINHSLFTGLGDAPRFYFVHSFYVECKDYNPVMGTTHYGHDFASVIHAHNVYGVQFHPEKSHRFGMQLLKNFIELL